MSDADRTLVERIEPLLPFLPMLESAEGIGEWRGGDKDANGAIQMPWFDFSPAMLLFLRVLSENGWVKPFDWMAWQEEAATYLQPETLARAGPADIQKLFTTHVRADRFFEGRLAATVESGHMAAIVRRLAEIGGMS